MRESGAETAAEVELPDRSISPHQNLVTASALRKKSRNNERGLHPRRNVNAGVKLHRLDATKRRRAVAVASRDMRYFAIA
jgi:hypothetical protein